MDTDELDQWLDDDDDGTAGRGPALGGISHTFTPGAFEDDPPVERATRTWAAQQPPRPGRPRWLLPLGAGAVVWLAVLVVVLLGRGGGEGPGTVAEDPMVLPGSATAAPDAAGVEPPTAVAADGLDGVGVDGVGVDGVDVDGVDPVPAVTIPAGAVAGGEGEVAAAAVGALRARLTSAGGAGEAIGYLEMATPVGVEQLDDATVLVLLDAVWLEGTDGSLDRAVHGRWAVPVAWDGTVLSAPWPVPGGPPPPLQPDPPTGALRLPDVEVGLTAAGWTAVVARAADPHPLLPDVVVALVDGTSPDGGAQVGMVLWLRDAGQDLTLLGVRS